MTISKQVLTLVIGVSRTDLFSVNIYLPGEERLETIHLLDEHRVAFELATSDGEGLVLTLVIEQRKILLLLRIGREAQYLSVR